MARSASVCNRDYGTDEFREKWERIGSGLSVPVATAEADTEHFTTAGPGRRSRGTLGFTAMADCPSDEDRVLCPEDLDAKGKAMVIILGSELEAALNELARRQGVAPEVLAVNALRERFLAAAVLEPRDEWERGLLEAARDCGVSLPDSALSSEALYD
jgi:predicted transcriptional regulator